MQAQPHTSKKLFKKIPAKLCLIISGALCLAGNILTTYCPVQASSSEYGLSSGSVTLDGTKDGSVTIALRTSVARSYVAIQGTWSTKETAQTSYINLSGMNRGGSTAITYGANGTCAWTPENGNGMSVAAGGEVLSATYIVNRDTPAGTYTISFSNGLFTYDINGSDADEDDIIASTATITVTRSSNPTNPETPTNHNTATEPSSSTNHDTQTDSDTSTKHDASTDSDTSTDHDTSNSQDDSNDHDKSIVSPTKSPTSDASIGDELASSDESSRANIGIIITAAVIAVGLAVTAFIIYRKKHKKDSDAK